MTIDPAITRSPHFLRVVSKKTPQDRVRKPRAKGVQRSKVNLALRAERFEELLTERPHLRILTEAARMRGMTVEPVIKPDRGIHRSQLLMDGIVHEVHIARCLISKQNPLHGGESLSARVSLRASRYARVPAHLFVIDIEKLGVLKAYRIPTPDLARRLFAGRPGRTVADIPFHIYGHGRYGPYFLDWGLERPTPAGP